MLTIIYCLVTIQAGWGANWVVILLLLAIDFYLVGNDYATLGSWTLRPRNRRSVK